MQEAVSEPVLMLEEAPVANPLPVQRQGGFVVVPLEGTRPLIRDAGIRKLTKNVVDELGSLFQGGVPSKLPQAS